jgi:hypothetical protein
MNVTKPVALAAFLGVSLAASALSAEPLNTDRRVHGIITAVEPGTVTICAIDGRHTITGRIDAARTRVTVNGKGASADALKVTFQARGEVGLDDVWLTVSAQSR